MKQSFWNRPSNMISKKEVQRIAKLARLDLTEKETKRFQRELCPILDYVSKLNEIGAETSKLSATDYNFSAENVMRHDRASKKNKEYAVKLLKLAPKTEKGYLKVKSILK